MDRGLPFMRLPLCIILGLIFCELTGWKFFILYLLGLLISIVLVNISSRILLTKRRSFVIILVVLIGLLIIIVILQPWRLTSRTIVGPKRCRNRSRIFMSNFSTCYSNNTCEVVCN